MCKFLKVMVADIQDEVFLVHFYLDNSIVSSSSVNKTGKLCSESESLLMSLDMEENLSHTYLALSTSKGLHKEIDEDMQMESSSVSGRLNATKVRNVKSTEKKTQGKRLINKVCFATY